MRGRVVRGKRKEYGIGRGRWVEGWSGVYSRKRKSKDKGGGIS